MSETKKKKNNPVAAYEVVQVENDKLKLIEGRYAWSKDEMGTLDGMLLPTEDYKIIRDDKTGKFLRVQDNRTIGKIIDDIRKRVIMEKMKANNERDKDIYN